MNRASNNGHDLGTLDLLGVGIDEVERALKHTAYSTAPKCIICKGTPKYKLVPIHSHLDTEEVHKQGYVCEHCIMQGYFSPRDYKLKEL